MPKLRLTLIVLAVLAAVVPTPATWVERLYTTGLYGWLQRWLTPLSNRVPFAAFDVAIGIALATLLAGWTWRLVRAPRGRRWRTVGRLAVTSLAGAAVLYLLFLTTWGLNYRRVPLTSKLDFAADRVTEDALRAMAEESVRQLNTLYEPAVEATWPELDELPDRLGPAFRRVQRQLPSSSAAIPGVPKSTALTAYFRQAAVDGMIDPFFLEVLINADVLPFERPFVVAHEWGHLAGFANESEASFVGWLVCQHGDSATQYSGWLSLYQVLMRYLPRSDRAEISAPLGPGPRAHLRAIAERWQRSAPVVRRTAARVYDRFLKANRVTGGIESYGAVVRLVLGTRFEAGWIPAVRPSR